MNKPSNFPALATAAAAWWRAAVAGEPARDNGDPTTSALATALARLTNTHTPTPAVLDAFQAALLARIHAAAQSPAHDWQYRIELACDYAPETLLAEAAHATGVSSMTFPWKTYTYIDAEGFWVSAGYGAPHVLTLAAAQD